ncbi:hypothetical protein E1B28_003908 [Marasmius oreades]|uniref:Ribosomal protein L1 n=1 Tax=Marasmius oreades TaxID=181124 RepID=A0A9P8ABT4_9AGAR|nr:uncharacterized protein E1B28_003908 [Marasmius oreades]KAG7096477.1 hypothetical protein E1B28_003908 [Marasmius oreades]
MSKAKIKDLLIDSHVSESQSQKAVDALHDWASKKASKDAEKQLLPGKEPTIWLCVALKQSPSGMTFKPVRIPIVHPLVDPRTNGVCLLTKDPQRKYKDLLESHDINFISRVVGLGKLKGKFKPFEARRALLKENGLFLADQSILPLLPKLLGVKWFEAKKQPIPVCMTRKDLKAELERAISSTHMNQNKGTAISIKIGTLSQKPSQILANLKSAIPAVASHIKGGAGGWENIQSLGIKTNNSAHLPIWSCALDGSEGGRWAGLTAPEEDDEDVEMEDGEEGSAEEEEEEENENENEAEPVLPEKSTKKAAAKGTKKRGVEDDDDDTQETAKPKKKAKSQSFPTEDASVQSGKRKPAEPEVVTSTLVSTGEKKSKKKNRRSDSGDVSASVDVSPATPTPTPSKPHSSAAEIMTPAQTKKARKRAAGSETKPVADPSPSAPPTTPAPTPVVAFKTEKKKKKDRKSLSAGDAPPPAPAEPVIVTAPAADELVSTSASTKQSKKEKRKSSSNTEKADVEPVAEAKDSAVEEKGEKKKQKKVKKSGASSGEEVKMVETSVEKAALPTLSKKEIKQKKAAGGVGEKKKEKVIKSKGGKSAKDALLGKKAGQ